MPRLQSLKRFLTAFILCSLLWIPLAAAEENTARDELQQPHRHFLLIARQSLVIRQEIDELLKRPSTPGVNRKIEQLQSRLNALDLQFESMATQLPLEDAIAKEKKKSDWFNELEELTSPILQAIRDLTEKPRAIDKLKKQITQLQKETENSENAHRNLSALIATEEKRKPDAQRSPEAEKYLSRLRFLQKKYDPELAQLSLVKALLSLDSYLATDESFLETVANTMRDFFKNRGRNLAVTAATFIGLWWILFRIRKSAVGNYLIAQMSPAFGKVFSAAYNVFVLTVCLLASLACLYFFNDWLLLSLLAMALILTAWTSRHWIPRFLQEIKLIVNLGSVREGERILWQGIPWQVDKIGLVATLVNENLQGGEIKLPVRELIDKHSRKIVENEPWFPTKPRDWAILADDTYGEVDSQTMEQVVLKLKGGAFKTYPTAAFLAQTPLNISRGFRFCIRFGLDYDLREKICDEIPKLFEEGIRKHLRSRFEGDAPDFTHLEVEFDRADASSLNLMIVVHVDGRLADRYEETQREIHATLIRVCNENGLVIPFNRLTINLSNPNQEIVSGVGQAQD